MKYFKFLFSPVFMGSLFVIFAVAMAIATFIGNDYGSGAAYSMVYNTRWFELILLLLVINLIGQVVIYKLLGRKKLAVGLFHLAFIIMIIGAGITRYFGWEGSIHLREGETGNSCTTSQKYIGYRITDENGKVVKQHYKKYSITTVSADNFRSTIRLGDNDYKLILARILPNATRTIADSPGGTPVVSLVLSRGMMTRETVILKKGDSKAFATTSIGFDSGKDEDIQIHAAADTFYIRSKYEMVVTGMMDQSRTIIPPGQSIPLKIMQIISAKDIRLVPQKLLSSGVEKAVSVDENEQQTGQNAFVFHLLHGNDSRTVTLWDKNTASSDTGSCVMDDYSFDISYGSRLVNLPFSLRLDNFELERYPGSDSPSGYKSEVTLIDRGRNIEEPFNIYMNNILKYRGFRFYQASYDNDEKGTVLSVNHDMTGMLVTYAGYALLFLFIILSLLNRNSALRTVKARTWSSHLRKASLTLILFAGISWLNNLGAQKLVADRQCADEFGRILVQDQKGRTKPLYTLSSDILRKVTRDSKFKGYTPVQVFMGIYLDFDHWKDVPMIMVSNRQLQKEIGITGNLAAFTDLVNIDGSGNYKLAAKVNAAYSKSAGERNKLDKEIMKVDERVNIVYMIYKGDFLKIFPLRDGSHNWGSPEEALKSASSREDSLYLQNIIPLMSEDLRNGDFSTAKQIIKSISDYQKKFTQYRLPPEIKTNAELLYYKAGIFELLFPFYSTVGLIMIIALIVMVIRGSGKKSLFITGLSWIIFAGFLLHTFGLVLRWYISGHSPMSNGYESMIFISWVTLLAGFIFRRKSAFALSATAVLAGLTLMVAHLSFMDPEITNLVPVLKSYWLTLHVSVITGSYGFLGLGAILSLINLVLLILVNAKNRERISDTVDELTVINFITITLGLYFLTIGTFLGAIWANESWGRYWGWDPKETWSLITVIIYAFVTHSRMIPGMKDIFTFNLLSLSAFFSVLMTYFGVNYYLSGLHSYAGGEPVPIPVFVYITVIVLVVIAVWAHTRYNKMKKNPV